MKKLLPPHLFYISIFAMILLNSFLPILQLIPFPYYYLGIIPIIAGLLIAITAKKQFKLVGTNISTFNEPDILVTDGLFQYTRNPMYLGFIIALTGLFILLGSLSALFVIVLFMLITDRCYINFEERMLIDKFPEAYTAYKAETRRWI